MVQRRNVRLLWGHWKDKRQGEQTETQPTPFLLNPCLGLLREVVKSLSLQMLKVWLDMALGSLLRLGSWIRQMSSKDAFWPLPCCTFYRNTSIKFLLSFLGTMQKPMDSYRLIACLILETATWNCQKSSIDITVIIRTTKLQWVYKPYMLIVFGLEILFRVIVH